MSPSCMDRAFLGAIYHRETVSHHLYGPSSRRGVVRFLMDFVACSMVSINAAMPDRAIGVPCRASARLAFGGSGTTVNRNQMLNSTIEQPHFSEFL